MIETYVLDSFALLAFLRQEEGNDIVSDILQKIQAGQIRGMMTWINVGEVAYIVQRKWGRERAHQILGTLEATELEIVPADRDLTLHAADIKAKYPISYADAFAAALTLQTGGTLVTGDPEFLALEASIPLRWIRRPG